jgi:hypothetical protein
MAKRINTAARFEIRGTGWRMLLLSMQIQVLNNNTFFRIASVANFDGFKKSKKSKKEGHCRDVVGPFQK